MQIDWKKVGLFILFLIIGIIIFYAIIVFSNYLSRLILFFFALYIIFLFFTVRKFSKTFLGITVAVPIIYLFLMLIPFAECSSSGHLILEYRECNCLGFEKGSFGIYDDYWSQCIGIITEQRCYEYENNYNGNKHEIPCE